MNQTSDQLNSQSINSQSIYSQSAEQSTALTPAAEPPLLSPSPFVTQAPFLVEHLRLDQTPSGSFRPDTRLVVMPAFRTGSLWHLLPGEEMKTLLLLLTFLTPNGWCRPTLTELAQAMRLSEHKAKSRLDHLAAHQWHGFPLVSEQKREGSLSTFVPTPGLMASVQEEPRRWSDPRVPDWHPAGREAVVAYSRARYGRPRAEVEQGIAQRMGWKQWEDPQAALKAQQAEEATLTDEQRDLLARLQECGVDREQAMGLIAAHEPQRIQRQLDWLPFRHAKSPARFLLAAIAGDYAPPLAARHQHPQILPEPPNLPLVSGASLVSRASLVSEEVPGTSLAIPELSVDELHLSDDHFQEEQRASPEATGAPTANAPITDIPTLGSEAI